MVDLDRDPSTAGGVHQRSGLSIVSSRSISDRCEPLDRPVT